MNSCEHSVIIKATYMSLNPTINFNSSYGASLERSIYK